MLDGPPGPPSYFGFRGGSNDPSLVAPGIAVANDRACVAPPASREEIAELMGSLDSERVDRICQTGASLEEIAEAIEDLEGRFPEMRHVPSSSRVLDVREILEEVVIGSDPRTLSIHGVSTK